MTKSRYRTKPIRLEKSEDSEVRLKRLIPKVRNMVFGRFVSADPHFLEDLVQEASLAVYLSLGEKPGSTDSYHITAGKYHLLNLKAKTKADKRGGKISHLSLSDYTNYEGELTFEEVIPAMRNFGMMEKQEILLDYFVANYGKNYGKTFDDKLKGFMRIRNARGNKVLLGRFARGLIENVWELPLDKTLPKRARAMFEKSPLRNFLDYLYHGNINELLSAAYPDKYKIK